MNTQKYFLSLRNEKNRPQHRLYTRTANALFRGGHQTMEQVCALPEEKLRRVRNLGEKCVLLTLEERERYRQAHHIEGKPNDSTALSTFDMFQTNYEAINTGEEEQ